MLFQYVWFMQFEKKCQTPESSDLESPESVDHLCAKCDQYALNWAPKAEELWEKDQSSRNAQSSQQE